MSKILSIGYLRKKMATGLVDMLAILFIYFIPSFSHLTGIPFYLFEPMRVFIILALLHSNKSNAYILALTLPVFSFAVASHPVFLKTLIISIELTLNVYLYNLFIQKKMAAHLSILLSITASKLVYYFLKFILIQFLFLDSVLITTPLAIQIVMILMFSIYSYMLTSKYISPKKKD